MKRPFVAAVLASAFVLPARAEVVTLKTGEVLRGKIVSRSAERIVVEAPSNRWEVDASRIASIEERDPLLAESRSRFRATGDTDADGFYRTAGWCAEKGLFDLRETVLQWVIAIDPDHEKARSELGYYRTADGKWVKGSPGGSATEGKFKEAVRAYRKKEDAKAEKLLKEILEKAPADLDANFLLGEMYHVSGKNGHARQQFEAVIKSDPNYPWGHYGLSVIALADGKFDEAEGLIRKALGLTSSASPAPYKKAMEAEFYYVLGMCQKARGDAGKPDADKSFRECIARDKRHYRALTELGVLEGERSRYKEAVEFFSRALVASSKYAPAKYNWGVALYQQGDIDGAMNKLSPLTRTTPPYVEAFKIVGRCYHRYGKNPLALQNYNRYQQLGGTDPRVAEWILEVK